MKAIRVDRWGPPEVLQLATVADLNAGPGQILVRIYAAGVNPVETYIRSGTYGRLPQLPYTPGSDAAGLVHDVGAGVDTFRPGDRVYVAGSLTGTYAEYCLCTPGQVYSLPSTVSYAEGAALGVPYATAHRALFQRGHARPGETVLIHGGTGGVGTAALQLAKSAGLRVFATGGTETGRLLLTEQGADAVFDHHEVGYGDQILARTGGGGVDLILEMLANLNLGKDLSLLTGSGRVIVVGSRGTVELNPRDLMAREADIRGVMLTNTPPEELAAIHRALAAGLANGLIRPVVAREFTLEQASEAHELVMSPGAHGKIVLLT